jgi:hypothetical protein
MPQRNRRMKRPAADFKSNITGMQMQEEKSDYDMV